MKALRLVMAFICIMAMMGLACNESVPSTPAPTAVVETEEAYPEPAADQPAEETTDYSPQIAAYEAEDWGKLSGQITIEDLTEEDRTRIAQAMTGEDDFALGQGGLNWDGNNLQVNPNIASFGTGETAFIIPSLQLAPQAYQSLYEPFIHNPTATSYYAWEQLFHWTNHMPNRFALSANGAWFNQIVAGGMNGQGVIYKFAGTDTLRTQYLFVTRMSSNGGPSMPWGVILSEGGAPITGYNTGMKGGNFSEKEAARFVEKMLQRGYTQIQPNQLPAGIRNNWGNNAPPVIRFWMWSLAYQVELYARVAALSVSQAASALMTWASSTLITPLFFIVPDCESIYMPGICPMMEIKS